ncbi:MAG: transposase [Actinomycetota bacterium]|nr:transposase [Actinomycetota bacterium]
MPKSRPPYPRELREQLIAMARAGRTPEELARDYEPSAQTIRNWLVQADVDDGVVPGVTSGEGDELRRLRRENRILREEREILKKAAAWFAEETNSTPSRRSSS